MVNKQIEYNLSGGDLGLSLTGMRIGPLDPTTHKPKVGIRAEVVKPNYGMGSHQQRMMKVFKFPYNYCRKGLVFREVSRYLKSSEKARSRRRACFMTKIRRRTLKPRSKVTSLKMRYSNN